MKPLENKVAVVTGGSRGIGAAICQRLAADGAHVAVNYAKSADAAEQVVGTITAAGGKAFIAKADLATPDGVAELFKLTDAKFGRKLDILVNNAGVFEVAPIGQATPEMFDKLVNLNVRAVFLAATEAFKRMGDGGRIVTIGSVSGDRAGMEGSALYSMTKAAVQGLTRGWARDLGQQGITVNCVQPGPIDTDMNPDDGDFAEMLKAGLCLGRYGHADEVAALVAFVASPAASYMTGACLDVDGGLKA